MNHTTPPKNKADATKRAKQLCAFINKNGSLGNNWKYEVRKNGMDNGYHFNVYVGTISLHENNFTGKYWVLISDVINNHYIGAGIWGNVEYESVNPVKAIKKAVFVCKQKMAELNNVVQSNDKLLQTTKSTINPRSKITVQSYPTNYRVLKTLFKTNLTTIFGTKIGRRLRANGIETVLDLTNKTTREIYCISGIGKDAMQQINQFLTTHVLKLKSN